MYREWVIYVMIVINAFALGMALVGHEVSTAVLHLTILLVAIEALVYS
jgi:hypothetical protein